MADLDNPAGRLHNLLNAYQEEVSTSGQVKYVWSHVLGTDERVALLKAIAEMGTLVAEVYEAVSLQGRSAYQDMCDLHITHWTQPFRDDLEASPSHVEKAALVALNAISDFLSERASEGSLPDDEERQSLRDELLAVIEETKNTEDTPAEVRQLILERLHEIVWALDHLHIEGPGAVTAAVERLAGSLVIMGREAAQSAPAKQSMSIGLKVWCAFASGPAVQKALEAWPDVVERMLELGRGT
jgi:hypothetical protein